jgi:transposase-like protein
MEHPAHNLDVSPLVADPEWFRDLRSTEARCRAYLEELRWPDGVCCPRCDSSETARLVARRRFWCRDCHYQFSVTAGTLFHNSHAPLWKWFLAAQLLIDSDGGLPANQLVRQLGGSYKTAWFIEHRVRAALMESRGQTTTSWQTREAGAPEVRSAGRVYDRSIVGRFHQQGTKHLAAYRAEREWLSEHAGDDACFRELVLALVHGGPLPYSDLVRRPAARSRTPEIAAAALA